MGLVCLAAIVSDLVWRLQCYVMVRCARAGDGPCAGAEDAAPAESYGQKADYNGCRGGSAAWADRRASRVGW